MRLSRVRSHRSFCRRSTNQQQSRRPVIPYLWHLRAVGPSNNKDATTTGSPVMFLSQEQSYKLKALALAKDIRQSAERFTCRPGYRGQVASDVCCQHSEPKPAPSPTPFVTTSPLPTILHDTVASSSNRKAVASTPGKAISDVISKDSQTSDRSSSAHHHQSSFDFYKQLYFS